MRGKKGRDPRAQKLVDDKKRIREQYARIPLMDWFRRDEKPKKQPGVQLEKNDVLAMILAALSLVVPWVLCVGAVIALILWVLGQLFG